MNDSSDQVITATIMPEVEIDDTAPGEIVLIQSDQTTTRNSPNPLLFFIPFVPFIFLGAIATVATMKLILWAIQKSSENRTNAPVAAAYREIQHL